MYRAMDDRYDEHGYLYGVYVHCIYLYGARRLAGGVVTDAIAFGVDPCPNVADMLIDLRYTDNRRCAAAYNVVHERTRRAHISGRWREVIIDEHIRLRWRMFKRGKVIECVRRVLLCFDEQGGYCEHVGRIEHSVIFLCGLNGARRLGVFMNRSNTAFRVALACIVYRDVYRR